MTSVHGPVCVGAVRARRARLQRLTDTPGQLTTFALLILGAVLAPAVATGPHLFDAGELAEASVRLGGSHPPGQPLHAILSHAFLWIPLGTMAARLALFSLVTTLVAAAALAVLTHELCEAVGVGVGVRGTRMSARCELAKAVAAASLVLADPVLRQALRIEVYGLALALTLSSIALLVRWARLGQARSLVAAALAAGLCASTHPPQAACAVLVGVALCVLRPKLIAGKLGMLALAAVFCALGLLPYLYLSVRSLAGAVMWGEPATLAGLLEYISARAYAHKAVYADANQSVLGNALGYGRYLIACTFGLPLIGAGVLLALKADRNVWLPRALLLALAAGLATVSIQPLQENVPDIVAYTAPVLGILLALGATGFAAVGLAHESGSATPSTRAWIGTAALLCLPVAALAHPRTAESLRADLPVLDTLTLALVESAPPRAMVVATTDFTGASWMMARAIERTRPDVVLFVAGLATSSWHWASLASHPAFDGTPQRGPGRDAHERYLHGAIAYAAQRVPVVLERDAPLLQSRILTGGYALIEAPRAFTQGSTSTSAPGTPQVLEHSMGERFERILAAQLASSPNGDSDAAHAIVRDHFVQRAERLLHIGRLKLAMTALRSALPRLPEAERKRIAAPADSAPVMLPMIIEEPRTFLVSSEQAVRVAAAALWSIGQPQAAVALLEAQAVRGDTRAVLQLCTLEALSEDRAEAMQCLQHLQAVDPSIALEAAPLLRMLQSNPRPAP